LFETNSKAISASSRRATVQLLPPIRKLALAFRGGTQSAEAGCTNRRCGGSRTVAIRQSGSDSALVHDADV
jgi:hypothetical protein